MSVPIGFSLGDLIGGAKILRSIVKILRDQQGAAAEYQEVIREIEHNALAFEQLQHVRLGPQYRQHANAIIAQVQRALSTVNHMHEIVMKNKKVLSEAAAQAWYREPMAKAKWAVRTRKSVKKHRSVLEAHTIALRTLVAGLTLELSSSNLQLGQETLTLLQEKNGEDHCQLEKAIEHVQEVEGSLKGLMASLQTLAVESHPRVGRDIRQAHAGDSNPPIREFGGRLTRGQSTLTSASDTQKELEYSSFNRPSSGVWSKTQLMGILENTTTLSTSPELIQADILRQKQAAILLAIAHLAWELVRNAGICFLGFISQLDSLPPMISFLLPDNMTLIDALGRTHTLPLSFFCEWRVLESMLICRFQNAPGASKVARGQYRIFEAHKPKQSVSPKTWSTVVAKRKKFRMSIIFSTMQLTRRECAKCHASLTDLDSLHLLCKACGMFFLPLGHTASHPWHEKFTGNPSYQYYSRYLNVGGQPDFTRDFALRSLRATLKLAMIDEMIKGDESQIKAETRPSSSPDELENLKGKHLGSMNEGQAKAKGRAQITSHTGHLSDSSRNTDRMADKRLEETELPYFTSVAMQRDTRLHDAALDGNADMVSSLISVGFDVRDNTGCTGCSLNAAIISNSLETVNIILQAGADPFSLPALGPPPIALAVRYAPENIAIAIIMKAWETADQRPAIFQNMVDRGLFDAVQQDRAEIVYFLIQIGANPACIMRDVARTTLFVVWQRRDIQLIDTFTASLWNRRLLSEGEAAVILGAARDEVHRTDLAEPLESLRTNLETNYTRALEKQIANRVKSFFPRRFFQLELSVSCYSEISLLKRSTRPSTNPCLDEELTPGSFRGDPVPSIKISLTE